MSFQGVQDKLDDPFDGVGEDDINVDTFDEWSPILESIKRTTNNIKEDQNQERQQQQLKQQEQQEQQHTKDGIDDVTVLDNRNIDESKSGNIVESITISGIDFSSDFDIYSSSIL